METHKRLKPYYSQACDRLNERIFKLIGHAHNLQNDYDEKQTDLADASINVRALDGTI